MQQVVHGLREGSSLGAAPAPPDVEQTNRLLIDQRLLFGEADKEVRVGDTVEYVDTAREEEVKTVQITKRTTALDQGFIAERTPLAQALLGGVVADEVALNIPGVAKRILRIVAIKRDTR